MTESKEILLNQNDSKSSSLMLKRKFSVLCTLRSVFWFHPLERMVVKRYLRPSRKEGFTFVVAIFSLIGLMLGVATLIIVMSVMNGFQKELLGKILGLEGHLSVYANGGHLTDYQTIRKKIQQHPNVVALTPIVENIALARANDLQDFAFIRGITAEDFRNRPTLGQSLIDGDLSKFTRNDGGIIIGSLMAQRLGLQVGSTMNLTTAEGNATPFGLKPRTKDFTIVGIFELGMSEYDKKFIFMPLEMAQVFFRVPDAVTGIDIVTKNPVEADRLRQIFTTMVMPHQAYVVDWKMKHKGSIDVLEIERTVMFIILTLIILVAAFNIISSLIMLSRSKRRDIAILRTMGATRGMVMRIFFLCGIRIGVGGVILGSILGLLFCWNIKPIFDGIRALVFNLTGKTLFDAQFYFLSSLPVAIDYREVIIIIAMALILSLISTLYPALQASRMDPVQALRND